MRRLHVPIGVTVCGNTIDLAAVVDSGTCCAAAVEGDGQRQAFIDALGYLKRRIELSLMLSHASIDDMAMRGKLAEIGREQGASALAKDAQ